MEQFSSSIEAAVVNHGGAMGAETISKNGRSSKSHMCRGKNKHFKFIAFLTLIFLFSSCSQRIIDFTVISSKNHTLKFDLAQGKKAEGTSMMFLGLGTTIKSAMDNALELAGPGYDLLIDGVVYRQDYFFVAGFKVTGTAVMSRALLAHLGEEGFQHWLAENNVFDPEIADVQK